jgi:hypothetical protein
MYLVHDVSAEASSAMNGVRKMGSESGARYLDPVADLGIRARWSWRRAERRAVAEHEQWLAANLRRLAAAGASVFWAAESATSQATARTAGIVRLRHRGWQLLLAGVASGPRAELEHASLQGRLRLDAAGRYGRFWWVEIVSDGAARGEKVVLLGSQLWLTPAVGGRGRAVAPLAPGYLGVSAAQ